MCIFIHYGRNFSIHGIIFFGQKIHVLVKIGDVSAPKTERHRRSEMCNAHEQDTKHAYIQASRLVCCATKHHEKPTSNYRTVRTTIPCFTHFYPLPRTPRAPTRPTSVPVPCRPTASPTPRILGSKKNSRTRGAGGLG